MSDHWDTISVVHGAIEYDILVLAGQLSFSVCARNTMS